MQSLARWILLTLSLLPSSPPASADERIEALFAQQAQAARERSAWAARLAALEDGQQGLAHAVFERRDAAPSRMTTALDTALARWRRDAPALRRPEAYRLDGSIRFKTYYNSHRANDPVLTYRGARGPSEEAGNDDQFLFDLRSTRLGLTLAPRAIGELTLGGRLEFDFANVPGGSTESRATPRLRFAYLDLKAAPWTFRIGQDSDLLLPLIPAANREFLLWGTGNVGDRRAQVQARWNSDLQTPDRLPRLFAHFGLGQTGAVDSLDLDGTGGGRTFIDGFDSGHPHVQARVGGSYDLFGLERSATVGLSGYLATLETDRTIGTSGRDRFRPSAIGLDLVQPLSQRLSLRLEAFLGQALSDVRGNILQAINTETGAEIFGWGGWVELVYQVTDELRWTLGAAIDDPKDGDLRAVFGQDRSRNAALTSVLEADLGRGLSLGFEAAGYFSSFVDGEESEVLRLAWWLQLDF